jgi:hypothetical protein
MKIWKRIQLLARRPKFEEDLAEEIRFHREMAGTAAFGSVAMSLEDSRAVWGFAWLDSWLQDLRYAVRGFRKTPAFALTVIGTIGLALGLNTTVFTVFDAYMLKPYAVRDPYSLYWFTAFTAKGQGHSLTWQEYSELAHQKSPFTDALAYEGLFAGADGHGMFGELVSGNYFTMLGADVRAVIAMVVKQSMRLAGIGAVAGVGLMLALAPIFAHELKAINPYDFVPYAGGVLLVLAAVLAASFYPSRRAVRIDPATTLRCD